MTVTEYAAILLLILIAALSVWLMLNLSSLRTDMETDLADADGFAAQENWQCAEAALSKAIGRWDRSAALLRCVLHHDRIREIDDSLWDALEACRGQNISDYRIGITKAKHQLETLVRSEYPLPENIF